MALSSGCAREKGDEITIRLARRFKTHFFKESRVRCTACHCSAAWALVVHDWYSEWNPEDGTDLFRNSVASLASAVYSTRITNAKRIRLSVCLSFLKQPRPDVFLMLV
jgi:hypothetical protein